MVDGSWIEEAEKGGQRGREMKQVFFEEDMRASQKSTLKKSDVRSFRKSCAKEEPT